MGTLYVDVEIGGLNRREFVAVNALVDTGSTHTTMPESLLNRLSMTPERNRRFESADGRIVEYPVGYTRMRYNGKSGIVPVEFTPNDVEPLIGATTLEILGMAVNPVSKELLPVNFLLK